MKLFLGLILLILPLGLSNHTFALYPIISPTPLSSQIAQPTIVTIFRDSNELLWIGTQEGLYRFDGSSATVFNSDKRNKNWIPASDIRAISERANGDILVATYGGGLLEWDRSQSTFRRVAQLDSNKYSDLMNLEILKNGNYLFSTKDSLAVYDIASHSIDPWLESQDMRALVARPFVFFEANPSSIYVGSSNGLTRISLGDRSVRKYDLSALEIKSSFGVTALEMKNDNELIIGTDTGHVAILSTSDGSIFAKGKIGGNSSVYVSDISRSKTNLLIATDRGLYYSDDKFLSITDISHEGTGLSNSDIYALYTDGEYTYIGTYNGLDVLSLSPFRIFNSNNSTLHNDVLAFDQDDSGRIWVGTYDGLYVYDPSSDSHSKFSVGDNSQNLADHRITAIAAKAHFLWLGYYQGDAQIIDLKNNATSVLNIERSEELNVTDIDVDNGGQDVWVATYNHGLIRVRPDQIDYFIDTKAIPHRKILVLFRLSDGRLLIATSGDVYLYDPNSNHISNLQFDLRIEQTTPLILSINEDKKGDIWFGTKDHGLFRWKRKSDRTQFQVYHVGGVNGLKYSTIYGIEIDDQSNIWCSTQSGIVKLDPEGNLIKRFTTIDGLQGNDFNLGASFTSREGMIYFGGANGYNRFDPAEVEIDRTPSPMRLTGITLPGKKFGNLHDFSGIDTIQLAHADKFITFEFSVLDFIHPEKNQFRYMLRNFDSDWIDSGNRNTATYNNLPSGDYVLRVQGANSAGIWNEDGITLKVQVLPPPWRTWWAFCFYFLSFLFFMWCALRIYRSYVLDRESRLLAMEMFEAENSADDEIQEQLELQDELVQSAYDHNLALLALIDDCISYQTNDPSKENALAKGSKKRIYALSHLEDSLYYYEGGPVVNLKKYADILISELLKASPIDPDSVVTINEISPRLLPAELASPLAIVLFELLENCFQHAFDGQSPANYIRMIMAITEQKPDSTKLLKMTVSDNGVGLQEMPDRLVEGHTGIGIVGALVNRLGGTLEFSLEHGTSASVTVPVPGSLDF